MIKLYPPPFLLITMFLFLTACLEENPQALDKRVNEFLTLVNLHRNFLGFSSLQLNDIISIEAEGHSINMARAKIPFGHEGFEERFERIRARIGGNVADENVAFGQLTAAQTFADWISSPDHKANIEGDFDLMGIGIAEDASGNPYYTQIFLGF